MNFRSSCIYIPSDRIRQPAFSFPKTGSRVPQLILNSLCRQGWLWMPDSLASVCSTTLPCAGMPVIWGMGCMCVVSLHHQGQRPALLSLRQVLYSTELHLQPRTSSKYSFSFFVLLLSCFGLVFKETGFHSVVEAGFWLWLQPQPPKLLGTISHHTQHKFSITRRTLLCFLFSF